MLRPWCTQRGSVNSAWIWETPNTHRRGLLFRGVAFRIPQLPELLHHEGGELQKLQISQPQVPRKPVHQLLRGDHLFHHLRVQAVDGFHDVFVALADFLHRRASGAAANLFKRPIRAFLSAADVQARGVHRV